VQSKPQPTKIERASSVFALQKHTGPDILKTVGRTAESEQAPATRLRMSNRP
jgi:hypothetical protein